MRRSSNNPPRRPMRRMSAPEFDDVLRHHGVAERFDILRPSSAKRSRGSARCRRRAAARAAAFEQRGMEPAAMLVRPSSYQYLAAVALAHDAGELREMLRVFQHEGVRRAGSNQTSRMSSTFCQPRRRACRKRSAAPACTRHRRPPPRTHRECGPRPPVLQISTGPVALVPDERGDRHAPGTLARDHPVRPALDHAGDAVLALRRHPDGFPDGSAAGPQCICLPRASPRANPDTLSCADSVPLSRGRPDPSIGLSIAMNHCGVLRKITGFFGATNAGYWCLACRAMIMPASASALTGLVMSPFALVVDDALGRKPGACAVNAPSRRRCRGSWC